jgi:hypothetical protein
VSRAGDPAVAPHEEAADLRVRIFELENNLKQASAENSRLLEKMRNTESQLSEYETGLAALAAGGKTSDLINRALLAELVQTSRGAADLERSAEDLILFTRTALESLKAEPGLLQEQQKRSAVVREGIRALRSAGITRQAERGTILSVNPDLEVVAITLGYADGVKQGDEWAVVHSGKRIAVIRSLAVRRLLSLATVVEGELRNLPQGAAVEKIK